MESGKLQEDTAREVNDTERGAGIIQVYKK